MTDIDSRVMEVIGDQANSLDEKGDQIDAICEYLGIEIVLTKSGRWKCIKVEPEKPKNDHVREQQGYYGE